nr:hypothetical protein [Pseudomonas sp. HS-2]
MCIRDSYYTVLAFMAPPVSYTHLDVYKRQLLHRAGLHGTACLLYTSRCV